MKLCPKKDNIQIISNNIPYVKEDLNRKYNLIAFDVNK